MIGLAASALSYIAELPRCLTACTGACSARFAVCAPVCTLVIRSSSVRDQLPAVLIFAPAHRSISAACTVVV